jgi:hypothetical protein
VAAIEMIFLVGIKKGIIGKLRMRTHEFPIEFMLSITPVLFSKKDVASPLV